jgi:hypothetical protein
LVAVDDMKPLKRLKEFDWYRKDSSFVSLFSDWESPVVPNVTGTVNMNIEVTDELVLNLRALHESSISWDSHQQRLTGVIYYFRPGTLPEGRQHGTRSR